MLILSWVSRHCLPFHIKLEAPIAKVGAWDIIKVFHWPFILKITSRNPLCYINFVSLTLSSKYVHTDLAILGPTPESSLTYTNNEAL